MVNVGWGRVSDTNAWEMIHIGQLVRQELRNKGYTISWLARKLNCSRTNVYKILDKASLDTSLLVQLSLLLDVDFFLFYTEDLEKRKEQSIPEEE